MNNGQKSNLKDFVSLSFHSFHPPEDVIISCASRTKTLQIKKRVIENYEKYYKIKRKADITK